MTTSKKTNESDNLTEKQRRQIFWTEIMRSEEYEMRDRLKAAELLGESQGDFIHRHEHSGPVGGPVWMQDTTPE